MDLFLDFIVIGAANRFWCGEYVKTKAIPLF
jgi:hypothetical protein